MLKDIVAKLKEDCNAEGAALVGRDGVPMAVALPENVKAETFSIMCATMVGAAITATSELRVSVPQRVIVEGSNTKMIITNAGRKAILAVIVSSSAKNELIYPIIDSAVTKIKEQMGA